MGLLKRNAADRLDFDLFFNHPFIRPVATAETPNTRVRTSPVKVPSADRGSRHTTPTANEARSIPQSTEPTQNVPKNPAVPNSNNTRPVENNPPSPHSQYPVIKSGAAGRKTSPNASKPINTMPRGQQPGLIQSPNTNKQFVTNG